DWCSIPAGRNPDGLPPNFENPQSLQPTFIAISSIMLTLAIIITSGRLYVNRNTFRLADYSMIVGLIFDIGLCGIFLAESKIYRHVWDTPICWYDVWFLKISFAASLLTAPALFFPKAAIFLFYIQIFSVKKSINIGSKIGIAFALLAYLPPTLAFIHYDVPHAGQGWDDVLAQGMLEKGIPLSITMGVASVIVDVYVFTLPLPTIFSLNMNFSKKLQIIALFTTAFMGIVASVACLAFRVGILLLGDGTWQAGRLSIVIIVEINVAIMVGSLPAFTRFLRIYIFETAFFKSLRFKFSTKRGGQASGLEQRNSWKNQVLWTYGSPHRQQPQYHELSDSLVVQSR
ncbi:hypothetical protein M426DRAFT_39596, partial [Hypoxylon sp. CI-4A]